MQNFALDFAQYLQPKCHILSMFSLFIHTVQTHPPPPPPLHTHTESCSITLACRAHECHVLCKKYTLSGWSGTKLLTYWQFHLNTTRPYTKPTVSLEHNTPIHQTDSFTWTQHTHTPPMWAQGIKNSFTQQLDSHPHPWWTFVSASVFLYIYSFSLFQSLCSSFSPWFNGTTLRKTCFVQQAIE